MDAPADGRNPREVRARTRTGILLSAAAALTTAALPASATQPTPAPTPTPPPDPVVVDCFSKGQIRPDEYLLACGDGNNRLVKLH
ncbi:hypothetical protein [Streptomyces sp. fd1-xmd]|uniref:hypothetical protein n=1 Tax=Streptomyces sp. fd1-xmd TaxID=1812480 RepID=UPI00099034E7|nr:hypothetical protein [Streptomyces sp. fd1-xmd]AQT76183.1 hypothetical protein B1K54_35465 [Streptomyces sp. fd1-xmd]